MRISTVKRKLITGGVMLLLVLTAFGSASLVSQDSHGNVSIVGASIAYADCNGPNPQPDPDGLCDPTPTATPTPDGN
jgi:hypothetical protein